MYFPYRSFSNIFLTETGFSPMYTVDYAFMGWKLTEIYLLYRDLSADLELIIC
jgi:hypothetical protein